MHTILKKMLDADSLQKDSHIGQSVPQTTTLERHLEHWSYTGSIQYFVSMHLIITWGYREKVQG